MSGEPTGNVVVEIALAVCAKLSEFRKRIVEPTVTLVTGGAYPASGPNAEEVLPCSVRFTSIVVVAPEPPLGGA